ncbi:MAG: hypothetical protein MJZ68_08950, partial [archaeon]|nr:hypothetical protein [archaeon]
MVFGNGISIHDRFTGETVRVDDEYEYPVDSLACFSNGEFHIFSDGGVNTVTRGGVEFSVPENAVVETRRNRLRGLFSEQERLCRYVNDWDYNYGDGYFSIRLRYGDGEAYCTYDTDAGDLCSHPYGEYDREDIPFDEVFKGMDPFLDEKRTSSNGTFYLINEGCIFGYTPVVENNRRVRLYRRMYTSPEMGRIRSDGRYLDPSLFKEQALPDDLSGIKWVKGYIPGFNVPLGQTVLVNEDYYTDTLDSRLVAYLNGVHDHMKFHPVSYGVGCYCTSVYPDSGTGHFFLALSDEVHTVALPKHMGPLFEAQNSLGYFKDGEWVYRYSFSENIFEKVIPYETVKEYLNRRSPKVIGSPDGTVMVVSKKDVSNDPDLGHEILLVRDGRLIHICDCSSSGLGIAVGDKVFTFEGESFAVRDSSDGSLVMKRNVLDKDEWFVKDIDREGTLWMVRLNSRVDKVCKVGVARMKYPYDLVDEFEDVQLPVNDPWNLEYCVAVGKNQAVVLERTGRKNYFVRSTRYPLGKDLSKKRSCLPRYSEEHIDFMDVGERYLVVYNDSRENEEAPTRQSLMDPVSGESLRLRFGQGGQMHGPKGYYLGQDSHPFILGDLLVAELTDGHDHTVMGWNLNNGRRWPDNDHERINARLLGHNEDYIFVGEETDSVIRERVLYNKDMQGCGRSVLDVPLRIDPRKGLGYPDTFMTIDGYRYKDRVYTQAYLPLQLVYTEGQSGTRKVPAVLIDPTSFEEIKAGLENRRSEGCPVGDVHVRVNVLLCTLQYGIVYDRMEAVIELGCSSGADGNQNAVFDVTDALKNSTYAAFRDGVYYLLQKRAYDDQCCESEYLWRLSVYKNGSVEYVDRIVGTIDHRIGDYGGYPSPVQLTGTGDVAYVVQDRDLSHHHMVGNEEMFDLNTSDMLVSVYCDKDISVSFDDVRHILHIRNGCDHVLLSDIYHLNSSERIGDEVVLIHEFYVDSNVTIID